eukprot:2388036-Alexandrium_andersonii.AAC.1
MEVLRTWRGLGGAHGLHGGQAGVHADQEAGGRPELEGVRLLPLSRSNSCHAVATGVLPKGLYACEAAPVAERELARLRGRIAEYLGPGPG